MNKNPGLLGLKIGMTQIFNGEGNIVPVTVVEVGPCTVLQIKTAAGNDGYDAIQIGFGSQKPQRTTKAFRGHAQKAGLAAPPMHVREIRVTNPGAYSVGQTLTAAELFSEGQKVDVSGTSKGRGYAGVMKRHNFRGFLRSHGTHEFFRHGGSIGTRLTPGHVAKGRKMSGQQGNAAVTVQNLTIAAVDAEKNLIFIKGGIPGATKGVVMVQGSNKG
ncbi:MAG: 50S ribosomal protein L3 [Alphaproteobacteria bacterium]|nr:50S ribosomal protein L3 [Alphaproteobacteria bacterium]MCB9793285.1 50S ribosomal protein L3 [Alphaproteobacteria bacterium]